MIQPPRTPAATAASPRTNVFESPTTFRGRAEDLRALDDAFAGGDRVVTLVGTAGAGKTRLAQRYASERATPYLRAGGVWFCDVTEARTLTSFVAAVASTLGTPCGSLQDALALDEVGRGIAAMGDVFVMVDNCEQVAAGAAEAIGRWIVLAPGARFLVTSRERLGLPNERLHAVGPLSLPGTGSDVASAEAVRLFVDRTRLVRSDYVLTDAEAPVVAELVRKLDGLPLAIELAASRMRLLETPALVARLDNQLETLTHSSRTSPGHHRTLRAALEWSWMLLEPWEKSALAQCAVFVGGFTVEAAEAVLDLSAFAQAPPVLDVLQSLRDKSLVRSEPHDGRPERRLGLYRSIRDYAHEQLARSGELPRTEERHAAWLLKMGSDRARRAELGSMAHARELVADIGNLSAVHAREATRRPEQAARFALVLDIALWFRGTHVEHAKILEGALQVATERGDTALRAELLTRRSRLRLRCGQRPEARADAEEAVACARTAGAPFVEGHALRLRAQIDEDAGADDSCLTDYLAAGEAFRAAACPEWEARILFAIGGYRHGRGDLASAREHYARVIALAETTDDDEHTPLLARAAMAILLQELGHLAEAEADLRRVVTDARAKGAVFDDVMATLSLASVLHEGNEVEEAETHYRDAIARLRQLGARRWVGLALAALGALRATRDDVEEATGLLDSADVELAQFPEHWRAIANVCRGHVDLARARRSEELGDVSGAEAHRSAATRRLSAGANLPTINDDVRTALRMLQRAVEAAWADSAPEDSLLVAEDGSWFRLPRRWRVEVGPPHLREVLKALVRARLQTPVARLGVDEVLRVGWPGQRVLRRAGANRVHVAISKLRETGLREVLRSYGSQYGLDPAMPVVVLSGR